MFFQKHAPERVFPSLSQGGTWFNSSSHNHVKSNCLVWTRSQNTQNSSRWPSCGVLHPWTLSQCHNTYAANNLNSNEMILARLVLAVAWRKCIPTNSRMHSVETTFPCPCPQTLKQSRRHIEVSHRSKAFITGLAAHIVWNMDVIPTHLLLLHARGNPKTHLEPAF